MKASKVKELIKQSLLELEAEKKNTSNSGPMTPEEEEMIKRYEEEEANKYALEKEEPLEEGDVMKKAREIVAKHKEMTESEEGPEDISDYDRGKIETGKANTLARSINAAIVEVDPELHVETFAKGVAQVLKREYGSHLTKEFIAALRDNLRGYEDIVTEADRIVESWKRKNLLKESKKKEKPAIKILKDLYHFDKLGSLAAKDDVDEKYHKGAKLVFKKGKVVKDDTQHDDSEYEMIMKSKRLKKGIEYTLTESKRRKTLKENTDLLDQYLSIIQSNDMDSDQAHNYLENQGLDPQQIDSIMNHAFPTSSDSYEESDYIKRRKKEMYEVNEGMGDEKWITPDEVESDYSFYSDMYKGVYGIRPHGQSAEQLCNWLNSEFKLEGNRIVRKDGQDELYESDYMKRRKKEMNEADFKVQRVSKVVFPNGLSFRKGEEDMEGGIVLFIEKFPNGYAVSGNEFDWDNQLYGDEAYTYYYDLDGNESTEDEIVPDGYFKTDSDIS